MTALQLEPSAQAPWTSTIFMCVLLLLVARALLPTEGSAYFTFSEQQRCSSFPKVPSLRLTKFLSHVPPQQPHQDSRNSFTLQCSVIAVSLTGFANWWACFPACQKHDRPRLYSP